jgi:hypothetical protein
MFLGQRESNMQNKAAKPLPVEAPVLGWHIFLTILSACFTWDLLASWNTTEFLTRCNDPDLMKQSPSWMQNSETYLCSHFSPPHVTRKFITMFTTGDKWWFSLLISPLPTLQHNQPSAKWLMCLVSPGVKRPESKTNHSPRFNAEVKSSGTILQLFTPSCLIN